MNKERITELIVTTQSLIHNDEKAQADSLWDVVATINKESVKKVREDKNMLCKALAEIMKPEIDEAFDEGKVVVFLNMIKDGVPREKAQKYAEISDQLAEQVLAEN